MGGEGNQRSRYCGNDRKILLHLVMEEAEKVHKSNRPNRCSPLHNALLWLKLSTEVVESGEMWCLREEKRNYEPVFRHPISR